jgi:hypothetical protein
MRVGCELGHSIAPSHVPTDLTWADDIAVFRYVVRHVKILATAGIVLSVRSAYIDLSQSVSELESA